MKIDRKKIFDKFSGHCAYCGTLLLFNDFQVAHLIPKVSGGSNNFENLMPACRKCNEHKFNMIIAIWRHEIKRQTEIALRSSTAMQRALKWGLIKLTPHPIIFYFETLPALAANSPEFVRPREEAAPDSAGSVFIKEKSE